MNRWVVLVSFHPTAPRAEVQSWLTAANAVLAGSAGENLPGSVGCGDAVWDLRTDSLAVVTELLSATCVSSTENLGLHTIASGYRSLAGARIKRTLALTVRERTPPREVQRFERSLQAMPDHIPEIGSWSLSRVAPRGRWTHVWEQEYADVAGLRVAYMRNPYHWTGVDRWFDPEMPCSIVKPALAHLFKWADRPVLTSGFPLGEASGAGPG